MNTMAILSVAFRAQGVSQVLNSLSQVQTAAQRTQTVISGLAVAATAFATGAAAIAGASLLAYDSFARFEMGAKSLLGTLEGGRFAKAIQAFSVPSAFDPTLLRKGAQGLVSTGMSSGRSLDVLKAVTNLSAAGGSTNEEISRTLLALRQIQSKGIARAEEINQQIAESLPLLITAVREQAGRDPIGMKSDKFFAAIVAAGGKYRGAQEQLAAKSPVIALENAWQAIQNSLIPTGRALAQVLTVLLMPFQALTSLFSALNEATSGLLGLAVIGSLLYSAAAAMSAYIRMQYVGMAAMEAQSQMSWVSAQCLEVLAKSAIKASAVNGTKLVPDGWDDIISAQLVGASKTATPKSWMAALLNLMNPKTMLGGLTKAPGMISKGVGAGLGMLKPLMTLGNILKVSGWLTVIALAIEVVPRLLGNLGKIFGALWRSLTSAWESFSQTPFGSAIVKLFEALGAIWETIVSILSLDWLVKLMGIDEPDSENADKVAEAAGGASSSRTRPIRKSDAETWFYGRLADIR